MVVFNRGLAERLNKVSAFESAARLFSLQPAMIDALWQVESSGQSFYSNGVVKCKPELHYIHRYLPKSKRAMAISRGFAKKNWNDPDPISLRTWTQRYAFLEKVAKEYGQDVAIMSTSWGGPQIMGKWYKELGYSKPIYMYDDFAAREIAHLDGLMRYLEFSGLLPAVRELNWDAVARGYNGPANVPVYGPRLRRAYEKSKMRKEVVVVLPPPPPPPATPPKPVEEKSFWATLWSWFMKGK